MGEEDCCERAWLHEKKDASTLLRKIVNVLPEKKSLHDPQGGRPRNARGKKEKESKVEGMKIGGRAREGPQ